MLAGYLLFRIMLTVLGLFTRAIAYTRLTEHEKLTAKQIH